MRNQPLGAVVYGIDLGKTTFHVVGIDVTGRPIQRVKLSRATIFKFFSNASQAMIGMEACPGSQWLARKLAGARSHRQNRSGTVRQAVRQIQQE